MGFENLIFRLLEETRRRIQNGQLTERGLARAIGVSQPHIHHILKGKRGLNVVTADRLLRALTLELRALDEDPAAAMLPGKASPGKAPSATPEAPVLVPILDGLIGPGFPSPQAPTQPRYLPVPRREVPADGVLHAGRLAYDPRIEPLLLRDDLVVIAREPVADGVRREASKLISVVERGGSWVVVIPPYGGEMRTRADDREERQAAALTSEAGGERVGVLVLSIRRMHPLRLPFPREAG